MNMNKLSKLHPAFSPAVDGEAPKDNVAAAEPQKASAAGSVSRVGISAVDAPLVAPAKLLAMKSASPSRGDAKENVERSLYGSFEFLCRVMAGEGLEANEVTSAPAADMQRNHEALTSAASDIYLAVQDGERPSAEALERFTKAVSDVLSPYGRLAQVIAGAISGTLVQRIEVFAQASAKSV